MLSLLVCPKVITLSGFYCSLNEGKLFSFWLICTVLNLASKVRHICKQKHLFLFPFWTWGQLIFWSTYGVSFQTTILIRELTLWFDFKLVTFLLFLLRRKVILKWLKTLTPLPRQEYALISSVISLIKNELEIFWLENITKKNFF